MTLVIAFAAACGGSSGDDAAPWCCFEYTAPLVGEACTCYRTATCSDDLNTVDAFYAADAIPDTCTEGELPSGD
jgi:hypothetical protein